MSTLSENPVLFLAIENLSKMSSIDEKQLSTIWNLFTKCKDNLENGRRLENISWRLWYRSTHFPVPALEKNSTEMSTSFSQVLSAPFENAQNKNFTIALPLIESDDSFTQPMQSSQLQSLSELQSQVDIADLESINRTVRQTEKPDTKNFLLNEKVLLDEIVDQEMNMDQEDSRCYSSCPGDYKGGKKAKFFVSDSPESIDMERDCIKHDDDTDYEQSDYDDGFSYSTDWSWTPSPLFSKIPLKDLKEPILVKDKSQKTSQLSSALHTKNQVNEVLEESVHNHLSSSMKETLIWDRCMPFNTKYAKDRPIKEDWRSDDTAKYW